MQDCTLSLLSKIAASATVQEQHRWGGVGHMTVVIFNYTAMKNKGGSRVVSCSTAVSYSGIGRKQREGRKAMEQVSLSL